MHTDVPGREVVGDAIGAEGLPVGLPQDVPPTVGWTNKGHTVRLQRTIGNFVGVGNILELYLH